ncbi:alanine--tRNA ligase [bacterium]|nr:alanine--tRNA ligase [bacterium]
MTTGELREKFLKFFESEGHVIIPSASLIPENDPSALFISAGMHPLVPYLLGQPHPSGKKLANLQKCIRTVDIDEVGDDWHVTFLEMLGNWSLGDYFKKESITMSWKFLTDPQYLGISSSRISVSVFEGDDDAPRDNESADIWKSVGIPDERIHFYNKNENWWGPAGKTGPCGPDTEIFFDTGRKACGPDCEPKCTCGKYVEIWNNVFMEYNKTADGKYEKLDKKNVDTGMGALRVAAVLSDQQSVYESEIFQPILKLIEKLSEKNADDKKLIKSFRIIADHIRAATFILGDEKGTTPSNVDQGYILRRLIRRAIRHGQQIGIKQAFTHKLAEEIIKNERNDYEELTTHKDFIIEQLVREEEKFSKTLDRGLKEFKKLSAKSKIMGQDAFDLFATFGFPFEMTAELAAEQGTKIDEEDFKKSFVKHQELSRAGAEQKFAGGLADHSEETTKLHTANHLLLAALKKILGPEINQKGSNITKERLRFDFSWPEKITPEQIKEVEGIVNEQIQKDIPVSFKEMSIEEAKKMNATGVFEHKYGDQVKVYSMGDFSIEICGGPHVEHTGQLGKFKIKKEQASSAGVRRIKAVLE